MGNAPSASAAAEAAAFEPERVRRCILGDQQVGKSCIFTRAITNSYEAEYRPNHTVTMGVKGMQLPDDLEFFWCEMWDVPASGPARLVEDALKGCDGVLLVLDCNDPDSLGSLERWLKLLGPARKFPTMVVANKIDMVSNSGVTVKRHFRRAMDVLRAAANDHGCHSFAQVSALDGQNLLKSTRTFAASALRHRRDRALKTKLSSGNGFLPRPDGNGNGAGGAGGAGGESKGDDTSIKVK